ncbi:zinc finger protein RFP-like [Mastacembelus armatus]|uniref:zinc finger protein RFP-like n=1 Tax=Mastacembelus armatus TaxID=205130 RepID=UPI000E464194|nr:zinc finger protein RFP-like [Mastacembelus armatus]
MSSSSASSPLSEEQFLCSICLDVFSDPVTIPCGHNFCKNCITEHWNISPQCQCPMCKKVFSTKPEIHVNTFIAQVVVQLRQSAMKKDSRGSVQKFSSPGEVLCDICTGTKLKALKSCLVCLTSYCETHLELHQKITGLTKHKLSDPVGNLQDRMCKTHNRPLELFCKNEKICVCFTCTESDHKLHRIVLLMEEYQTQKTELRRTEAEIQMMIEERRLKIEEIKQSVKLSKADADRERADSVQVFTALVQSVERGLAQLIDTIDEKQKTSERQAEGYIKELEEEIFELTRRSALVQQLSHTEDHLQLLQRFPSVSPVPPTKDWTEVSVQSSYEGIVRRAVAQLEETLSKEIKKLIEAELKRVKEFAVDVTLDPETAHPCLYIFDNGKQVKNTNSWLFNRDATGRFSKSACVLGKQYFSVGKYYYEVQVNGKTNWSLGVAKESINRKSEIMTECPNKSLWAIWFRNGNENKALGSAVSSFPKREKVGVFVNYEEGLVSFYDVVGVSLIYDFTCCNFQEKLYPIFGPCDVGGKNSSPLSISPVILTN